MRRLAPAAALVAAFFAAPALASDACLGAQIDACLEAIRPHLTDVDYESAVRSIDTYLEGDITGKRKSKGRVMVSYHSKFSDQFAPAQLMELDFTPALAINEIDITLRAGAMTAESEDEYQASHMYEATIFALGPHESCREMATAHDFYLFFHQHIKPKLKQIEVEYVKGDFTPGFEYFGETGWIGICGKQIKLTFSAASWGALQADMERRYSSGRASLQFR